MGFLHSVRQEVTSLGDELCSSQVGNIQCPMMLVVGLDDQNWPSAECAEDVSSVRAHFL